MTNSIVAQVPKNLLFRYRVNCPKIDLKPKGFFSLPESCQLPQFSQFESQNHFADVRVGWCETGLFFTADVTGKQQSLWCRPTQLLDSDGVQIWIDTRDTHSVHRASKFCHWFLAMPTGGGAKNDKPVGNMLKINRSKDDPPTINRFKIELSSKVTKTGYQLSAFIPDKCLHGWNTDDHRQIGFSYAVVDRELGWQTMAIGPELPIAEDPSLWQTIQLVD